MRGIFDADGHHGTAVVGSIEVSVPHERALLRTALDGYFSAPGPRQDVEGGADVSVSQEEPMMGS